VYEVSIDNNYLLSIHNLYIFFYGFRYTSLMMARKWAESCHLCNKLYIARRNSCGYIYWQGGSTEHTNTQCGYSAQTSALNLAVTGVKMLSSSYCSHFVYWRIIIQQISHRETKWRR